MVRRLAPLMDGGGEGRDRVRIDEMVKLIEGGESLAPILFILTLPVLLPLPPGISMVTALPVLVVAPQMVIGRRKLWLPDWLGRRTLERAKLEKLLERIIPTLERLESVVRPRLTLLTGRAGQMPAGLACTLLGVILILPIPFANLLPSWSIVSFALGLTRRDGLLVLAGYALLIAALCLIALAVFGLDLGIGRIRALF